jgi:hypothetical protein
MATMTAGPSSAKGRSQQAQCINESSSPIVNITTSGNRAQLLPGFSRVDLERATIIHPPERD